MRDDRCRRCGDSLDAYSMSKFNTDLCCMECLEDEQQAPGYAAAVRAEFEAVRHGDYNFPGVGLGTRDAAFLAERLAQRRVR